MSSSSTPAKIVVVGGGYVGMAAALTLEKSLSEKQATIQVIEKSPGMFHCIAALRSMCDLSYVNKLLIPYDKTFKKSHATVVPGIAIRIELGEAKKLTVKLLPSGAEEEIEFDYLVLATGSSYPSPIKMNVDEEFTKESMEAQFKLINAKLKAASSCVVVGAGAVGCELAGEVASAFPSVKVTLIDSNTSLVAKNKLTDKLRTKLMEQLKELNVEVLLGESLDERLTSHGFEKRTLKLKSGKEIEADIQFICAGAKANVGLIEALDASLIDEGKRIKVKPNLELDRQDCDYVFVIGDANNHPTPKLAYWGAEQGKFLAKELANKIKLGKEPKPYQGPALEAMLLPLGPKHGVSQLPMFGGMVVGKGTTLMIKGDLFSGKWWSDLGAKVPK